MHRTLPTKNDPAQGVSAQRLRNPFQKTELVGRVNKKVMIISCFTFLNQAEGRAEACRSCKATHRTESQEEPGGLRALLPALPDVVTGFPRTKSKALGLGLRHQDPALSRCPMSVSQTRLLPAHVVALAGH